MPRLWEFRGRSPDQGEGRETAVQGRSAKLRLERQVDPAYVIKKLCDFPFLVLFCCL